jgi:hypothetical protein
LPLLFSINELDSVNGALDTGVMSAANVAAAVSNILGALIAPVPILWQMEHGNIGTCAFAAWTSLGCFVSGINAILWRDGVSDYAPGWCDVGASFSRSCSNILKSELQHQGSQ